MSPHAVYPRVIQTERQPFWLRLLGNALLGVVLLALIVFGLFQFFDWIDAIHAAPHQGFMRGVKAGVQMCQVLR